MLAKNIKATLLSVDFSKVFDSIYREKMEQILLTCGLPKDTIYIFICVYIHIYISIYIYIYIYILSSTNRPFRCI